MEFLSFPTLAAAVSGAAVAVDVILVADAGAAGAAAAAAPVAVLGPGPVPELELEAVVDETPQVAWLAGVGSRLEGQPVAAAVSAVEEIHLLPHMPRDRMLAAAAGAAVAQR